MRDSLRGPGEAHLLRWRDREPQKIHKREQGNPQRESITDILAQECFGLRFIAIGSSRHEAAESATMTRGNGFVNAGDIEQRFSRQIRFAPFGPEGQESLSAATAVIVGCGALGTVQASLLARAGAGTIRLIDRDYVEESNLQRQLLYTEADARAGLPKAEAARRHLLEANSGVRVEAHVSDLNPENADDLLAGADVILDGTDNFETRFLINDYSVREGIPWIYGAAVGSYGIAMPVLPTAIRAVSAAFIRSRPRARSQLRNGGRSRTRDEPDRIPPGDGSY